MKVAYEKLTTTINIDTDKISSIVIENEPFMYQMLMDLKSAVEGFDSCIKGRKTDIDIKICCIDNRFCVFYFKSEVLDYKNY